MAGLSQEAVANGPSFGKTMGSGLLPLSLIIWELEHLSASSLINVQRLLEGLKIQSYFPCVERERGTNINYESNQPVSKIEKVSSGIVYQLAAACHCEGAIVFYRICLSYWK